MNRTGRKTAIVTGGTSGLGRALVIKLLEKGWNVATFGRRQEMIDKLVANQSAGSLLAESCDMRIESQVSRFFSSVEKKFGNLDVCILNAGTLGPLPLPEIRDMKMIDLRMTFETNFFAHFNVVKNVLSTNDKAIFVHITSDAAEQAYPGWGAYGSSKVAMDFIMKTLENEGRGRGIRALSMDPGDMDTEMHRLALPEDTGLKKPEQSAEEIIAAIEGNLEADSNE